MLFSRQVYGVLSLWAYATLGLLWSLVACTPPTPQPNAPIRILTTDLAMPLLEDLLLAYTTTQFIEYIPTSPTRLQTELEAGQADLGFSAASTSSFATPIGYMTLTVIVHPSNPLTTLTPQQVQDIFRGRITGWGQLGLSIGGRIQVVSREDGAEGSQAFMLQWLANEPPVRTALVAPTWAAMHTAVSEDVNAIGYLPMSQVDGQLKSLALSPEWRILLVATAPTEPLGPTRDFLAWIQSPPGQAVVGQHHQPLTP